jgi:hypothetical protein
MTGMSNPPLVVTQDDAIAELIRRSGRQFVPIRKTFLQQGAGRVRTGGPLSTLCKSHDERGLDLYLLFHLVTAGGDFTTTIDAAGWARALGLSPTQNGLASVSKAFARLDQQHQLLERGRSGNRGRYRLLDESGSEGDYEHPARLKQPYLKLVHDYWLEGWHNRLTMPAKTLLLIALSLKPDFILPRKMGPRWYGIGEQTVQRGLAELEKERLLSTRIQLKKAALTATGTTQESHYTLRPPFAITSRATTIIPFTKPA